MVAMLWVQAIILGKKTYANTPRQLKNKVKEILINDGRESLIIE